LTRTRTNGRPEHHGQTLRWLEWAFLGLGAIVIALLWDAHGISWDESVRSDHGEMILAYFLSLGSDRSVNDHGLLRLYTALPDAIAAALYRPLPDWQYPIRHTVSAVFALATVPALFRYAKLIDAPWAGPLASAILLTMPVYFGHAFINSKDIPLACAMAWAMLALGWLFQGERFTWRRVGLVGLGLGFPLAIRPGIWPMLMFFLLAAMVLDDLTRTRTSVSAADRRSPLKIVSLVAISWGVMVVIWPWAHENPLAHPLYAMLAATRFETVVPVLFDGTLFASDELPRRYLLKMLIMKTPSLILALVLVGLVAKIRTVFVDRAGGTPALVLAALWLLAPLAAWTLLTPNIYDGVRHFLFVLPPLSLWAAVGALQIWRVLCRAIPEQRGRAVVGGIALVALLLPIGDIVRLHPYEMTYYNRWVGGVSGATDRFDTDYWVTSYREAAEWVNQEVRASGERARVLVAANELSVEAARHFLPADIEVEGRLSGLDADRLPDDFDYYIGMARLDMHRRFPQTPVRYEVSRNGAVFAVVKSHREPRGEAVERGRDGS
jgi:4-amino-4-deoxy-L-arabinose transferase-like glycosyltransferase